jgi:hypothetical protein
MGVQFYATHHVLVRWDVFTETGEVSVEFNVK